MNFRQHVAKYVTRNMTSSQLPALGVIGLEEGLDTPSLLILAGLGANESHFTITQYFKLSLEELQITLPDERTAALEYALAVVDDIVKGEMDIIEGMEEVVFKALYSYDFHSENRIYVFDSIGFEKSYGLLGTYDDLCNADKPWQPEKTNQQLMTEVKDELLEELKQWSAKQKPPVKLQ